MPTEDLGDQFLLILCLMLIVEETLTSGKYILVFLISIEIYVYINIYKYIYIYEISRIMWQLACFFKK